MEEYPDHLSFCFPLAHFVVNDCSRHRRPRQVPGDARVAHAIGPIFFGPTSEFYSQVRSLQVSNLWYLAWNLGCGFATTKKQLFAFRFLAGIVASTPLAIGGGSVR